mgnify:CR=1 FL=1
MLATNGESSLVGHCHVNSLRRRFTTLTRDPRSHSQLPKVRLASRSQQKFFAKVSPFVVFEPVPGSTLERASSSHDSSDPPSGINRRTDLPSFPICLIASRISSVSDLLVCLADFSQGHECCTARRLALQIVVTRDRFEFQ